MTPADRPGGAATPPGSASLPDFDVDDLQTLSRGDVPAWLREWAEERLD